MVLYDKEEISFGEAEQPASNEVFQIQGVYPKAVALIRMRYSVI
jgi:hypothetical protein